MFIVNRHTLERDTDVTLNKHKCTIFTHITVVAQWFDLASLKQSQGFGPRLAEFIEIYVLKALLIHMDRHRPRITICHLECTKGEASARNTHSIRDLCTFCRNVGNRACML